MQLPRMWMEEMGNGLKMGNPKKKNLKKKSLFGEALFHH